MEIIQEEKALQEAIEGRPIVIVQFGSEACGPCKALQNRIQAWNRAHPAVGHLYLSVEQLPALCAQMGVFTVPTVFVYAMGRLTLRESGCFSLDQMLHKIETYEQLLD